MNKQQRPHTLSLYLQSVCHSHSLCYYLALLLLVYPSPFHYLLFPLTAPPTFLSCSLLCLLPWANVDFVMKGSKRQATEIGNIRAVQRGGRSAFASLSPWAILSNIRFSFFLLLRNRPRVNIFSAGLTHLSRAFYLIFIFCFSINRSKSKPAARAHTHIHTHTPLTIR